MKFLDLMKKDVVVLVDGERLLWHVYDQKAGEITLMWGDDEEQRTVPDTLEIEQVTERVFRLIGPKEDELPSISIYKDVKSLSEL